MPLRTPNDKDPANRVLQAVQAVVTPNTQWAVKPGDSAINAWSALYGNSGQGATFPFLMFEEETQHIERVAFRTWHGDMTAMVHYVNRWDRSPATIDAIWGTIDTDLRRMKANVEDNPTLTVQLSDELALTRHAVNIYRVELTPYAGSVNLGIYPFGLVARTMRLYIQLPSYAGSA